MGFSAASYTIVLIHWSILTPMRLKDGGVLEGQRVRTITILFHPPCGPIYANLPAPHSLSIIGSDEANESDITLILK